MSDDWFEKKVLQKLRAIRGTVWFEQESDYEPAIVGCVAGQFYALKLVRDKTTGWDKAQLKRLTQVIDAGGAVVLVNKRNWKWHIERIKRKAKQ